MTQNEILKILAAHKLWLQSITEGARANLSGANLSRAALSGANLSRADLSGAYLSRADLSGANLSGADLSGANLLGADLSGADLSNTILNNKILVTFQFKKHPTFYSGLDEITIGCKKYTIETWLHNYEVFGKNENYSEEEIEKYGKFIKSCARDYNKELKK